MYPGTDQRSEQDYRKLEESERQKQSPPKPGSSMAGPSFRADASFQLCIYFLIPGLLSLWDKGTGASFTN